MPLVVAERTWIADQEKTRLKFVSIHTGDPGTSGTGNEASGGGYQRVALTWGAASNGVVTANEAIVTVPAGTYTHFGVWETATGGTIDFRGGNPLSTVATMAVAGQIKITVSVPVSAT